jgi:trehalose/maltose transport system permease protein
LHASPDNSGREGLTVLATVSPKTSITKHRTRLAAWLILPTLLVVLIVAVYPLAQVIYLSLTDASLSGTSPTSFVGLENYRFVIEDPEFREALLNTLRFTGLSVSLEAIFGMVVALVLNETFRGRALVRAAVLVPWAIPTVVSAQMFRWMLHDVYGVINILGVNLGLLNQKVAWLAQPATAMAAVVTVDVWKTTPFMALLLLAGLQLIPKELYEAASIDGATRWQKFTRVTLPLLRPTLLVALIFRTLDALRVFDVVFIMTGGGSRTETMAVYNRRSLIEFGEAGYGSAVSVVILMIIMTFVVFYMRVGKGGLRD